MTPRNPLVDPRAGDLIHYRYHPEDTQLTTVTVTSSDLSCVEFRTDTPHTTFNKTLSFYSWAEKWKLNPPIDVQRFYPDDSTITNKSVNLSPGQTLTMVVPKNQFMTELQAALDTIRELNNVIAVLKNDSDKLGRRCDQVIIDLTHTKNIVFEYTQIVDELKTKVLALESKNKTLTEERDIARKERDTYHDALIKAHYVLEDGEIRSGDLTEQIKEIVEQRDVSRENAKDLKEKLSRYIESHSLCHQVLDDHSLEEGTLVDRINILCRSLATNTNEKYLRRAIEGQLATAKAQVKESKAERNEAINEAITLARENQLLREEIKRLNNTGDEVSVINNVNQIRLPPYVLEGLKVKPGDTVYFVRDNPGFRLVEGNQLHKDIGMEP